MDGNGPWIACALIADALEWDSQGRRVITDIEFDGQFGDDTDPGVPLLVMVTGGVPDRAHVLSVEIVSPSESTTLVSFTLRAFPREPDGWIKERLPVPIPSREAGIWWFRIRLDGVLKTAIPYQVIDFALARRDRSSFH